MYVCTSQFGDPSTRQYLRLPRIELPICDRRSISRTISHLCVEILLKSMFPIFFLFHSKAFFPCLNFGAHISNLVILLAKQKSDNLQFNAVGQWVDRTIVPLSDGPMFILIDWEYFCETMVANLVLGHIKLLTMSQILFLLCCKKIRNSKK